MTGNQKRAIQRNIKKESMLANLIILMGKFNINYTMLAAITGLHRKTLVDQIQHPDHLGNERLEFILKSVLDHIEVVRTTPIYKEVKIYE